MFIPFKVDDPDQLPDEKAAPRRVLRVRRRHKGLFLDRDPKY